ncbi:MAG: hypothetical protein ABF682_04330 [Liquorilactobacillus sp.]|uniref:hypothetical protein n=1 Tax=Liquorilactobacillus TaxID=2767888 RepID=UPI0039E77756
MISFEKTSTFVYKILRFVDFGELNSDVVATMPMSFQKCFMCDRVLKYGEEIYLGVMPHGNKTFCEQCQKKLTEIENKRNAAYPGALRMQWPAVKVGDHHD